jgi:hypothetical protein
MIPDQKVYVLVRLNEKSNGRMRPAAPAMCSAAPGDTGMRSRSTVTIATIATTISAICFTSAHVTACTPPITV